jgi:hypothetical protein
VEAEAPPRGEEIATEGALTSMASKDMKKVAISDTRSLCFPEVGAVLRVSPGTDFVS